MNRRQFFMAGAGAAAMAAVSQTRANTADVTLTGALALVPVVIGGAGPVLFLLDTGAAVTVVDGSLSGALGVDRFLPKSGPVRAQAAGLSVAGRTGFVSPAIADFKLISDALGAPVLGLLGSDFLSAFNVTLSYPERRLTLGPSMARPADSLPMRFAGMPFVEAEVRHGRSILQGEFGLDTGLDSGLKLKDSMTMPLMRLSTAPGSIVTMEGARSVMTGTADALRVGTLDVVNVSAIVTQDAPPSGAGQTYVGTIGAPTFRNRVLTLDYPGGWWSLSPVIL